MFFIGYPFFWFLLMLLVSIYFLHKNINILSISIFFVALLLGLSITPIGSGMWLRSIPFIFNDVELCKEDNIPNNVVILPGGLTSIDNEVTPTNWSRTRIEQAVRINEFSRFHEIILPGGDIYLNRREGEYFKQELTKTKSFGGAKIVVGSGSYSTFSNFKEIEGLLRKDRLYGMITSRWHAYRALKLAKNFRMDMCYIDIAHENIELKLIEYPWNFKAAIREYLAIAWYKLKGRI